MSSIDRTFEVGFALPGGATRGCYSAGVTDFLLQALQQWEKASTEQSSSLPPWRVHLNTIAGTSSGAITAGIAVSCFGSAYSPISNSLKVSDPTPPENNLYELWVDKCSADKLFATDDIDLQQARKKNLSEIPIYSILNSQYQDQQGLSSIDSSKYDLPIPKFAKDIRLYLTTANLRGVPYHIDGWASARPAYRAYHMNRHEDFVGFDTASTTLEGLHKLDLNGDRKNADWNAVSTASMGSSALPIAFPARRIDMKTKQYSDRITGEKPAWPTGMPDTYSYYAVDGAMMTNEPLELIRESMERTEELKNGSKITLSTDAQRTRGAMIILDPSPSTNAYKAEFETARPTILEVVVRLLPMLINEARFKPEELIEFADEQNVSKFMITPIREGRKEGEPALGTDLLNGFGGCLDREIRHHDFMLGRYNCQQFLKNVFVIPLEKAKNNPIFGEESEQFGVEMEKDGEKIMVVPIVPLVGTASEDVPMPTWPKFKNSKRKEREDYIVDVVGKRTMVLLKALAYNNGVYGSRFMFGINTIRNFVVDRIVGIITRSAKAFLRDPIKKALAHCS